MKYFLSKNKKNNSAYYVSENADGTLILTDIDGKPAKNAGSLIINYGGVKAFLAACQEGDLAEAIAAKKAALAAEGKKRAAENAVWREREAERLQADREMIEKAIADGTVIETTLENVAKVLHYLNSMNWGMWRLPKMSIGYRCNQYDCDGRQATTMKLNRPIEGGSMFCTGAPHGHLTKYTNL